MAIIISALEQREMEDSKAKLLVQGFVNSLYAEIPPEGYQRKEDDITITVSSDPALYTTLRHIVKNGQRSAGVNHAIFVNPAATEITTERLNTNGNIMVLVPPSVFDEITEKNAKGIAATIFQSMRNESNELDTAWKATIKPKEYRHPVS